MSRHSQLTAGQKFGRASPASYAGRRAASLPLAGQEPGVAYCAWVEAPFGRIHLAATPEGVACVHYPFGEASFVSDAERYLGQPVLPAGDEPAPAARVARDAASQIGEYLAGSRRRFDLPLDLTRQSAFQRRVLEAVTAIPWGSVLSYGEVAEQAGAPGAARAVGGVMASNPLPLVIPCHRVVRSGGQLGGFGGSANSLRHKTFLLGLEGFTVEGDLTREARIRAGPALPL